MRARREREINGETDKRARRRVASSIRERGIREKVLREGTRGQI